MCYCLILAINQGVSVTKVIDTRWGGWVVYLYNPQTNYLSSVHIFLLFFFQVPISMNLESSYTYILKTGKIIKHVQKSALFSNIYLHNIVIALFSEQNFLNILLGGFGGGWVVYLYPQTNYLSSVHIFLLFFFSGTHFHEPGKLIHLHS